MKRVPPRPDPLLPQYLGFLFLLLTVLVPVTGLADTQGEISHLLQHIENSGCIFIRNGKEYDSKEAREHIERKYRHAKRWVKTTEDFIKHAATRSSMSGEAYKVRCGDREILTADWLTAELQRFRLK
jgi:hypothetical protein